MTFDVEILTAAAIVAAAAGLFIRRFARELREATSEAEHHACAGCDGCGNRGGHNDTAKTVTFIRPEKPM